MGRPKKAKTLQRKLDKLQELNEGDEMPPVHRSGRR
jgi:hypothetical protein